MAGTLNPVIVTPASLTPATVVMVNDIDMDGNAIVNLATPVNANDAARKIDTEGITIPVLNSVGSTVSVGLSK